MLIIHQKWLDTLLVINQLNCWQVGFDLSDSPATDRSQNESEEQNDYLCDSVVNEAREVPAQPILDIGSFDGVGVLRSERRSLLISDLGAYYVL